jgi:hypothetical protein
MLLHPDKLSWFRANHYFPFRREATNINFIVFGLIRSGLEPTIYRARSEHLNRYTTDADAYNLISNSNSYIKNHEWQHNHGQYNSMVIECS